MYNILFGFLGLLFFATICIFTATIYNNNKRIKIDLLKAQSELLNKNKDLSIAISDLSECAKRSSCFEERASMLLEKSSKLEEILERFREDLRDSNNRNNDLMEKNTLLREQVAELKAHTISFNAMENSINGKIGQALREGVALSADTASKRSADAVNAVLSPFKESLKSLQIEVGTHSKSHGELQGAVMALHTSAGESMKAVKAMTDALKGSVKVHGNWGEIALLRIFETCGMRKGETFDTQVSVRDTNGLTFRPDAIVRFPDNRCVIIDAKTPLKHYEAFCAGTSEDDREKAAVSLVRAIKTHIDDLYSKNYVSAVSESFSDCEIMSVVMMFVPLEGALSAAVSVDTNLWEYAAKRNVHILSASSLISMLKMIESFWSSYKQNKNAGRVADEANKLYAKLRSALEGAEKISNMLESIEKTYRSEILNKIFFGSGNAIRILEKMRKLGVNPDRTIADSRVSNAALVEVNMEKDDVN